MEERVPRRSQGAAAVEEEEEANLEFEFPFVGRADSPSLADELFADGRIRPLYTAIGTRGRAGADSDDGAVQVVVAAAAPVAAAQRTRGKLRRLFLEESREMETSSSADGDGQGLDGAPPESYCVWAPGSMSSASPPRKSCSTGSSMPSWRRISDLVVGRSHSDGREKFLFLPANPRRPPAPPPKPKPKPIPAAAGGGKKPPLTVAYGAKASGGAPRRTFLPYREELLGIFANVNGVSRSHHHPY